LQNANKQTGIDDKGVSRNHVRASGIHGDDETGHLFEQSLNSTQKVLERRLSLIKSPSDSKAGPQNDLVERINEI
jgi:hypothetical protein